MQPWATVVWEIARASGFTAYGLVTVAVGLGLALSLRWQSTRWPRLITNEVHQFVTLLSLLFTLIHGLAVWVDPFMKFGWAEVLVPGSSHYRPLWVGLGIVAFYLGLAVGATSLVRSRIGYKWWRRFHYLTFLVWALATAHGIGTGSDTRAGWGVAVYALSGLLVMGLLVVRLVKPVGARGRSHPLWAAVTGLSTLAAAFAVWLGPLQPGWNAIANLGRGSGARIPLALAASVPSRFPETFQDQFHGTLSQGTTSSGLALVNMNVVLTGSASGLMQIVLEGVPLSGGGIEMTQSQVILGRQAGNALYKGQVTGLAGTQVAAVVRPVRASGEPLNLRIALTLSPSGNTVKGTLIASAASETGSASESSETGS